MFRFVIKVQVMHLIIFILWLNEANSSICRPWKLATDAYLDTLFSSDGCNSGSRAFQYKYEEKSNVYFLSPITSLQWSWSFGQELIATYPYTTNGGASFTNLGCSGSMEKPPFGVGCSSGEGRTSKVLPIYHSNPSLGTCTICQDTEPFAQACADNIKIYISECLCPGYLK